MRIPYQQLYNEFYRVLLGLSFTNDKAQLCAKIFASNSLDGVYSHGLNRFPVFVEYVKEGLVKPGSAPETISASGAMETMDGHFGAGMYNATHAMNRAIELSRQYGLGCVSIRNTNHWMRGGTYGWQAAEQGCIGICMTNTIAIMPPWGGKAPKLGNNPLVIAVPRANGHLVLDMAMSQFSYGKMQEHELRGDQLPVDGGFDRQGNLSRDPVAIRESKRPLPAGYWKGSGLSFMIDILTTVLSGGRSVPVITADGKEYGLSQVFMSIQPGHFDPGQIENIIGYMQDSEPIAENGTIRYPGESTLKTRLMNTEEGIPVNETIWQQVRNM